MRSLNIVYLIRFVHTFINTFTTQSSYLMILTVIGNSLQQNMLCILASILDNVTFVLTNILETFESTLLYQQLYFGIGIIDLDKNYKLDKMFVCI